MRLDKSKWEKASFQDAISLLRQNAAVQKKDYLEQGLFPVISQEKEYISGYTDDSECVNKITSPVVIFGDHTRVVKYIDFDFAVGADGVKILVPNSKFFCKFIYFYLLWRDIPSNGYSRHFKFMKETVFPLPPLPIQQAIAEELDGIQSMIGKCREQLEDYDRLARSIFHEMFGDPVRNDKGWEVKKLTSIAPICQYEGEINNKKVWLLNLDMIEKDKGTLIEKVYVSLKDVGNSTIKFNEENVLWSKLRPYLNKVLIPDSCGYGTSELIPLKPNNKDISPIFLSMLLRSQSFVDLVNAGTEGARMPRANMNAFRNFSCGVPPLPLQQQFATRIEAIEAMKEATKAQLADLQQLFDSRMQYYFS